MISASKTEEPDQAKISLSQSVHRYQQLLTRLQQRIQEEDAPTLASYLGISLTNCYDKRRGAKPLQYRDVSRLVERYGSAEDRQELRHYVQLRDRLLTRLKASPIPLKAWAQIIGQNNVKSLRNRGEQPERWEPEELAKIGAFLDDFGKL